MKCPCFNALNREISLFVKINVLSTNYKYFRQDAATVLCTIFIRFHYVANLLVSGDFPANYSQRTETNSIVETNTPSSYAHMTVHGYHLSP